MRIMLNSFFSFDMADIDIGEQTAERDDLRLCVKKMGGQ